MSQGLVGTHDFMHAYVDDATRLERHYCVKDL